MYNIWQRTSTDGPLVRETDFSRTSLTLFQQRFKARRLIRGYHGDHIGTTNFERWYLPPQLPSIHATPTASSSSSSSSNTASSGRSNSSNSDLSKWVEGRSRAGGRTDDEKRAKQKSQEGQAPVGSLMFGEVERRLDVLVFRACFAQSVWQAKSLVVAGKVKLNGRIVSTFKGFLRLDCAVNFRARQDITLMAGTKCKHPSQSWRYLYGRSTSDTYASRSSDNRAGKFQHCSQSHRDEGGSKRRYSRADSGDGGHELRGSL